MSLATYLFHYQSVSLSGFEWPRSIYSIEVLGKEVEDVEDVQKLDGVSPLITDPPPMKLHQ